MNELWNVLFERGLAWKKGVRPVPTMNAQADADGPASPSTRILPS
jgi:hypothetical protein